MSDNPPNEERMKRAIRRAARNQPLGSSQGVSCGDCNQQIPTQSTVKAYAIGDELGRRWKVSKVFHENCGDLFVPERIQQYDDTDAILHGTLVEDPSVSAGEPDEPQQVSQGNVSMIQAERGHYRIEDPEVETLSLMSEEKRQERAETMAEAEKLMEDVLQGNVDHPFADRLRQDRDDKSR